MENRPQKGERRVVSQKQIGNMESRKTISKKNGTASWRTEKQGRNSKTGRKHIGN